MKDTKQYYAAVTDAWKFFRKWSEQMPLNDEQWWQVVNEASAITNSHPEVKDFAAGLMVVMTKEMEKDPK